MARETARTSNLAIVALILSIVAVFGMLVAIGLVFSVAAIIAGHISRSQIKASGGKLSGKTIAAVSLIIGYLSGFISLGIIALIIFVAVPAYQRALPPREVLRQIAELKQGTPQQRYDGVVNLLSAGKQSDAEHVLDALIKAYPSDQRLMFCYAVCARSRWSMERAQWAFRRVLELDATTVEGNCAQYVLDLDEQKHARQNMSALGFLIKQHPDNPFLLWIMGVECREYSKRTGEKTYSRDAERCYRRLLEIFPVGPVMVHQTFANILSEDLGLHEEALRHRRIAVEMEPTGWTYEGLGNILSSMKRYDEANEAFAKMAQLDPDNAKYWIDWATSLEHQGHYDECIEKCKKAMAIAPNSFNAYHIWGHCLKAQKKYEEALGKFEMSMDINPAQRCSYDSCAEILKILGRDVEAQSYLGRSVEWIRQEAERGNAEEQFFLGVHYAEGQGVPKDPTKAVEWFRKAAGQGYSFAQSRLGYHYSEGVGVPKDVMKAVEWYQKAAEQGDAYSQYHLGRYYAEGKGIPKDVAKAIEWYQKALDQGYFSAQLDLGYYAQDNYSAIDFTKAMAWYKKAADQGQAEGQYRLGYCYYYGEGTNRNFATAIEWFLKAAEQGNDDAQYYLGVCYLGGCGVTRDIARSKEWYQKAADQGHAMAKGVLDGMQARSNQTAVSGGE